MRFRRLLAAVLAVVTVLSGMCLSAHAANSCSPSLTYDTIYDLPENLEIFKTVARGGITAVKMGGSWYYQFTRSGQTTVYIKATAFMTKPTGHRHLDRDNKALCKSLAADSNHNYDRICYYNTMTVDSNNIYDTYTSDMYRFRLEVGGAGDEFTTKCELKHCVRFTYNTKVPRYGFDPEVSPVGKCYDDFSVYVTPSTAKQYMQALTRSTNVREVTPTATVSVTNTGHNQVYLSRYTVSGKGNASTSASATRGLIDIAYSTAELGKSVVTAVASPSFAAVSGAFKVLLDMNMGQLVKTSKEYNTGKELVLSVNGRYVYKSAFASPIKLSNPGDWTQVVTKCNYSVGDAKFNVNFSF